MSRIQWNDELSVGVDAIDDQHKELIRIANGLMNAVDKGADQRVVNNVITRLRAYTVFHFNSEEKLMEKYHFPHRGQHEVEHRRLKADVKRFQRTLYEKDDLTPESVLNFLKIWLLKHILSTDREFAKFIHDKDAEVKVVQV